MKIELVVVVDSLGNWRASHSEMDALAQLERETSYHRSRRLRVHHVVVDVDFPPLPDRVEGEVPFSLETEELLRMAKHIINNYRRASG